MDSAPYAPYRAKDRVATTKKLGLAGQQKHTTTQPLPKFAKPTQETKMVDQKPPLVKTKVAPPTKPFDLDVDDNSDRSTELIDDEMIDDEAEIDEEMDAHMKEAIHLWIDLYAAKQFDLCVSKFLAQKAAKAKEPLCKKQRK